MVVAIGRRERQIATQRRPRDGGAENRLPASARRYEHPLYRWVDAAGVVNISDHPPRGRPYTVVRIDPNRNVVHMQDLISAARTAAKPAATATPR